MVSILQACLNGTIDAKVVAVISNKADAQGLNHAKDAGIPTAVVDHKSYDSREAFDRALSNVVSSFQADVVILAGFMRILTGEFVKPLIGKLLNIHPSLLPKYPGLNTHQRALDAGDTEAGATVHFVTEELDGGPAIIQARVPVVDGDTADSLSARILKTEHQIYIEAVRLICQGKITYSIDGKVLMDDNALPASGIVV